MSWKFGKIKSLVVAEASCLYEIELEKIEVVDSQTVFMKLPLDISEEEIKQRIAEFLSTL